MAGAEFRSLAIAGEAGTGKTTVARVMGDLLGWEVFGAGGEFRDSRSGEQGVSSIGAAAGTDHEHDVIDKYMVMLMRRGNAVVEGRVAGLVAVYYELPGVMKVLLACEAEKRYERIWDRERTRGTFTSLDDIRTDTDKRESENLAVFSRRYGISYLNRRLYDLVIDTGRYDESSTVTQIRRAMGR